MDVRTVPGVGEHEAHVLAKAGVETVDDLRRADPAALAEASDGELTEEDAASLVEAARTVRVLVDVPGLPPSAARRLADAGVADPASLVEADPEDVARASGLAVASVRAWREAARKLAGPAPAARAPAPEPGAPSRVVLRASSAAVRTAEAIREGVPIVTVRAIDDLDAALALVTYDAVVLREGHDDAVVSLDGEMYENVPLFKERRLREPGKDGAYVEEVRVKVEAIREKRGA